MEQVKFIDAESYQGKQDTKISFRQICLNQLSRITERMTKEWKGGYWQERIVPVGNLSVKEKIYIPDSRAEFTNGVFCLHDLLISYFDKKMNKDSKDINKELDDLKSKDPNEKVLIIRKLFQALNKLLFRKHYLEGKTFEDET